ncbi:transposase [Streptomyces sp. NPDC102365]|uniref:transposase n=1 Tax=Streptomyces sp. NPDC102365 TaxID=3366162 RepID=UPI0038093142
MRYLVENGIKWRAMPTDFPPWDRTYAGFRRRRDHALVREFRDRLRGQLRERPGRDAQPTAGVIDSQSVKADAVVGADSRGFDGGKQINGRKRHAVVDALGLLLDVMVTSADVGVLRAAIGVPTAPARLPRVRSAAARAPMTSSVRMWPGGVPQRGVADQACGTPRSRP